MNLVPVGELKPLSWFKHHDDDAICRKLADDGRYVWYTWKGSGGLFCQTVIGDEMVQPLPDCDSFDWQPPREPTALELAKAWLQSGEAEAGRVYSKLREIIAAMEREAKQ